MQCRVWLLYMILWSYAATGLAGCSGGGDKSKMPETGRMVVRVTDEPLDAVKSVHIQFRGITLIRNEDQQEIYREFPSPTVIDVAYYRNGNSALLADLDIPSGKYRAIRLAVDSVPNVRDSYAELITGEECELSMPPADEHPWDIYETFEIGATPRLLTLHIDLFQSLRSVDCVTGVRFVPTAQLTDDAKAGWFEGEIDAGLIGSSCHPKVYMTMLEEHWLDDMGTKIPLMEPIAVAGTYAAEGNKLKYRTRSVNEFRVPVDPLALDPTYRATSFCPIENPSCSTPGHYLLGFTCDEDNPEIDEDIKFLAVNAATVKPGGATEVNFTR